MQHTDLLHVCAHLSTKWILHVRDFTKNSGISISGFVLWSSGLDTVDTVALAF
jgi:hypothetical protein